MSATTGTGGTGGTAPNSGGAAIGTGGAAAGTAPAESAKAAAAIGGGGTGAGFGAASAVSPRSRLVSGTGGAGSAATGGGAGGASTDAADCKASGTVEGSAAKLCIMLRQGTPGLAAGSAVAVALSTTPGHVTLIVATANKVSRFVVRDMVFADLVDGTATGRSFTLLTKLLKEKL
jgi:hypothetical protein